MKRSFLYLGVIALLSMAACKAETEVVVDNPKYNPDDNTVTADFVLNISTTTGKDTKTTAEFAQVNSDFLGMQEVHLLTYNLDYTSADHGTFFYRRTDTKGKVVPCTRDYNLGSLFPAGAVNKNNSSRTLELALPLGTNCVVLYGKALKTHSDDLQGSTFASGDPQDLTTLTFTLSPRLSNHAAFEAGSYFFSRMLTCFLLSGVVDERENGFWGIATGTADRSYAFWFPIPTSTVAESLPSDPSDQQSVVSTVDGQTYTFYKGQLSWKQLGTMYDYSKDGLGDTDPEKVAKTENVTSGEWMKMDGLNEVMGGAYSALVTIKTSGSLKELRAGSASAILRTVQDLYSIVERVAEAEPLSWSEMAAKELALVVKAKMELFFEMKSGVLDFLKKNGEVDITTLKNNLSKNTRPDEWASNKSILDTYLDASYFPGTSNDGFPVNIGLPVGAAILTSVVDASQSEVDYFSYTEDIPAYGMGAGTFPIANYRYPAELMYWGNSALRISSLAKTENSYPSTIALWNTEGQWSQWDSFASVKSDTRSVAMVNNINYGTALLESSVVFGSTKLADNNAALHKGEQDNVITVSSLTNEKGFYVTGVVVGGQADVMGWNYLRKETGVNEEEFGYDSTTQKYTGILFEGNEFNKMIFDKVTDSYKVAASADKKIYTMVWDNYDATLPATAQSDVYIGLELVNKTGQDLWGETNLIRNGGTFYLLGKMDLSDAVAAAREDNAAAFTDLSRDYYCYPPFDMTNGKTINAPRVFMQDYVTKAKLVLGEDALKHAYVTVPDLRSGQVSLGLSIDMDWEPGLAFEVNMGWLQ